RLGAEVAAGDGAAEGGEAHAPLDEGGDLVGLLEGDVERRLADHGAAVLEEDGAGGQHLAVAVGQRDGLAPVVEGRNSRKSRTKVDADQFAVCHVRLEALRLGERYALVNCSPAPAQTEESRRLVGQAAPLAPWIGAE